MSLICPVCCATNNQLIYDELYDDRYGCEGEFSLYRCPDCLHQYLAHSFKHGTLNNLYSQYYPRADVEVDSIKPVSAGGYLADWLNGRKARVCFWVPEKIRVLDIGCGFGETLLYHIQRGCQAYGIEVDKNVEQAAKHHQLNINTNEFDASDYEAGYFDFITMDQVIEHVQDPKSMLLKLAPMLKDNGKIIISTPNARGWGARCFGRKWINWHAPYHLHFFSRKALTILIEETDLNIIKYKQVTSSEWLYYQLMHLITYPEQGVKSLFWSNQSLQNKTHVLLRRSFNVLKRFKVFDVVTRFFDAIGMGDNQIFILSKQSSPKD